MISDFIMKSIWQMQKGCSGKIEDSNQTSNSEERGIMLEHYVKNVM